MIFYRKRRRLYFNYRPIILITALVNLCMLPLPTGATFRLCGFRLTMTLTAICKNRLCGGYVFPELKKPDVSPVDETIPQTVSDEIDMADEKYERRLRRLYGNSDDDDHNNISNSKNYLDKEAKYSENQLLQFLRQKTKRSGIATECCEKRCTLAYLRTYCCAGFQLPSKENSSQKTTSSAKPSPKIIERFPEAKNKLISGGNIGGSVNRDSSVPITLPLTYGESDAMAKLKAKAKSQSQNIHNEFEIGDDGVPVVTYDEAIYSAPRADQNDIALL